MKVLVTGATGYIGGAVAKALQVRGHQVLGLARSEQAAATLRQVDMQPVMGDFSDGASLVRAVLESNPDAVISTASVGSLGGDANTFARDRDAVLAMETALGNSGKTLIFTSGSAVFGVFNGGEATQQVFREDASVPLPMSQFAPPWVGVPAMLANGFGGAMAARVETEKLVLNAQGLRGIVVRPGLVYGHGGSFDLPALIRMARSRGGAAHLGAGRRSESRRPGRRDQPNDRCAWTRRQCGAAPDVGLERPGADWTVPYRVPAGQRPGTPAKGLYRAAELGHRTQPLPQQAIVFGMDAPRARLVAIAQGHPCRRGIRILRILEIAALIAQKRKVIYGEEQ